jgi:hypothetical protein
MTTLEEILKKTKNNELEFVVYEGEFGTILVPKDIPLHGHIELEYPSDELKLRLIPNERLTNEEVSRGLTGEEYEKSL